MSESKFMIRHLGLKLFALGLLVGCMSEASVDSIRMAHCVIEVPERYLMIAEGMYAQEQAYGAGYIEILEKGYDGVGDWYQETLLSDPAVTIQITEQEEINGLVVDYKRVQIEGNSMVFYKGTISDNSRSLLISNTSFEFVVSLAEGCGEE